ncbi:MAG TPA: aminotransferase class I/II-fold pyridoxal phosphate-dependent enzyme, partial [Chloroflexota bacterium]|nr:aminotransferase class I/II-fold pyridoxal phosphate-dependent enzyme [Chloroflexota bacterium]
MEEQIAPTSATGDGSQPNRLRPARRLAALLTATDGDMERHIAERRAAGGDILNLSVVEPELPPPTEALEQLALTLKAASPVRGAGGVPEYRSAVARWYQSRFKTSLDPNREVLPLPCVEDGITGLAEVLLDPDDVVLIPDPARPIYNAALATVGARAVSLPLRPEQDFLPELKAVPLEATAQARMLWLDYPNQPTGAVAPASFFHQVLQFAQERALLVVHIADFSEYSYDGYRTISLLEIPGARQLCVELHSPAYTY